MIESAKNTLIIRVGMANLRVCLSAWLVFFDQAIKGVWWMPRYQEAMKDVVTCDKPRPAGNKLNRGFPNGETPTGKPC